MTIIYDMLRSNKLAICWCEKHDKVWKEADQFERLGGRACEECCTAADRQRLFNGPTTVERFFHAYANVPLSQRMVSHLTSMGPTRDSVTLDQLYRSLHSLEDRMRPMRIERDILLAQAKQLLPSL